MFRDARHFFSTKILIAVSVMITSAISLASCVTVNVNFPEGAVQRAADDYVQELYRARESETPKDGSLKDQGHLLFLYSLFVRQAHADIAVVTDFPEAKLIQERQKERLKAISDLKKQGIIGESKDGLLVFWPGNSKEGLSKIQMKAKENSANETVEAENKDRKELYRLIIQKNNMQSSYLSKISSQFAEAFQNASETGTWVESNSGSWSKK